MDSIFEPEVSVQDENNLEGKPHNLSLYEFLKSHEKVEESDDEFDESFINDLMDTNHRAHRKRRSKTKEDEESYEEPFITKKIFNIHNMKIKHIAANLVKYSENLDNMRNTYPTIIASNYDKELQAVVDYVKNLIETTINS